MRRLIPFLLLALAASPLSAVECLGPRHIEDQVWIPDGVDEQGNQIVNVHTARITLYWSADGSAEIIELGPNVTICPATIVANVTTTVTTPMPEVQCNIVAWHGASLRIDGPTEPIRPGDMEVLFVAGLAASELEDAHVIHWPQRGVHLEPTRPWGQVGGLRVPRIPYIRFRAKHPGEYLVVVISGDRYAAVVITVERTGRRTGCSDDSGN